MLKSETVLKAKNNIVRENQIPEFLRHLTVQKWIVLVVLGLLLTLFMVPPMGLFHPTFTAGMVLDKDIRAHRAFLAEDRLSTEQKRMEVARTIEPVFDYERDLSTMIGLRISKAFSLVEEKYYREADNAPDEASTALFREDRLNSLRKEFEHSAGTALSDREFQVLSRNGFSSGFAERIVKLINAAFRSDLVSHDDLTQIERNTKTIIVRDSQMQREEERKSIGSITDAKDLASLLARASAPLFGRGEEELRTAAVSIAAKLAQPNLSYNKNATERRRQLILDQVKPVYFKIHKNELIARAGERLTVSDLNKLEAYTGQEGVTETLLPGIFFTIILFSIIFYQIARSIMKPIDQSITDVLFLASAALLQIILIKSGIFISESIAQAFPFFSAESLFFAIPFITSTLLVAVFLNRYIAFIYAIFSSILVTFLFEARIPMFIFSFLGSAVSAYHIVYFKQRSAFFKSGLLAAAVNVIVILCLALLTGGVSLADLFMRLGFGIAGGVLSGMIVAGITPVFETLFGYTTDIKLLELSNLNQPLLQRMIVEAPGTYHHSIIVASMVEAAAEAISANSLLAKVSAYYHDIGKLTKPLYFIENQQGWKNKHDKLSPKMSSLVIISHIKDGCDLAHKHKLGRAITDIIRQHHGMSIVSFFYEKAQKDKDPSIRSIPESDFRYPGPKPQTKEAGLVLLGDVVEASSRTLAEPTPSRIRNLVQSRIKQIFTDGQLDDCELTLHDVNAIAESFVRTLTGIFHQRIEYGNYTSGSANGEHSQKKENNGHPDYKSSEKNRFRS